MDKEAYGASGFEHGTVAGVLWQKGALSFAVRSQANSGPTRVGKEPYFHLRSIAPSKARDVPLAPLELQHHGRDEVQPAVLEAIRDEEGLVRRPYIHRRTRAV
jgi:hypothetical protein